MYQYHGVTFNYVYTRLASIQALKYILFQKTQNSHLYGFLPNADISVYFTVDIFSDPNSNLNNIFSTGVNELGQWDLKSACEPLFSEKIWWYLTLVEACHTWTTGLITLKLQFQTLYYVYITEIYYLGLKSSWFG